MDSALEFASRFAAAPHVKFWAGAFLAGFVLELIFTCERGQPWRLKLLNVAHALIYALVIFVTAPIVYGVINGIAVQIGLAQIKLPFLQSDNLAIQVVASLLYFAVIDFFYYWWHRAQHTIPVLWDQHAVHHSDTAVNVTTATRHHWSEFVVQAFVVTLPVLLLVDLQPSGHVVLAAVFGFWQFFIHLNVRLPLGPLTPVIAGPQLHRIHHSIEEKHRDRNFAAYTPIWDVLFGTYWHPRPGEYPATGLADDRQERLLSLQFSPFIKWGRRIGGLFRRAS